jgi:hypothetical protein
MRYIYILIYLYIYTYSMRYISMINIESDILMSVVLELLKEGGLDVRPSSSIREVISVFQDRSLIPLPSLIPPSFSLCPQADHVREEVGVGVTVPGAVVCKLMRGSKATAPLTQVRLTDTSLLRSAGQGQSRANCVWRGKGTPNEAML